MPRTIAADCDGVYAFDPAVWCTTASLSTGTTIGFARTISSFAPHAERETIAGSSALATARLGAASTRDQSS